MRPPISNTSHPAAVAPRPGSAPRRWSLRAAALLALAALACGLGACGAGGSSGAEVMLAQTFESHKPIESGRIDLSLALTPDRVAGGTPPAKLLGVELRGPFQGRGAGKLPEFSLQLALAASGRTLRAGATATSGQIYIELAGTPFVTPAGTAQQLQQSYAQTTRASSSAKARSTFAGLGVDPGEWLVDPHIVAAGTNGETTHIAGSLDVARFLADAQKISGAGGALGLSAGSAVPSTAGIAGLAGSVRSARVDVYTGTQDHLLRRLLLTADVAATPQARSALGLSSGATLTLDLAFAQLNQPQTITAPANPRPISDLGPALEGLRSSLGAPGG